MPSPSHAPLDTRAPWRRRLAELVESRRFQSVIIALIVVNAITLGLETSAAAMVEYGAFLRLLDRAILAVFVVEIGLRIVAHGWRFFRDGWAIFDLLVVGIALTPSAGAFSVLRALRVLRVMRLFALVPSMRRVVSGLLSAVPGLSSIIAILCIVFYVSAVIATKLFASTFPQWFGTIGQSTFSLFQIMTLEGWADMAREIMQVYPWAWAFFVGYILIVTFTMLNLFIAVIVNAMQREHEAEFAQAQALEAAEDAAVRQELQAMRQDIAELRRMLLRRAAE
jgi:voltage-gated sodium channel